MNTGHQRLSRLRSRKKENEEKWAEPHRIVEHYQVYQHVCIIEGPKWEEKGAQKYLKNCGGKLSKFDGKY